MKDIGEFGFIRKISQGCLVRPDNILRSIGDDAAAFRAEPGEIMLMTTDMLVERIHFIKNATSGFNLGYKALAVNLSDIAAMGGTAKEAFVSIAIPEQCSIEYIEDLYKGIKTLGAEFDVNILGGDTTGSKTDLIINISVFGSAPEKEILYRNTAQPGDIIFSTGFLGDSRAGLYLILNDIAVDAPELESLFKAHILPKPYLHEGRFLARRKFVNAGIDVSDGLSSDIRHIARESNVGVRLFAEKIPVSKNLQAFCSRFGFDPVKYALAGGEDYTLLCTVSRDKADAIAHDYMEEFNQQLYLVGEMTDDSKKMELVFPDGGVKDIAPSGWDHFSS
ncbi:MAG: thiamine-phosphate kinase [Desulfobacterales bacterium]|nr:thiamine-phosphate kinase [Desulfobacterales bacterium]